LPNFIFESSEIEVKKMSKYGRSIARCGILQIFLIIMVLVSGFAMGVPNPKEKQEEGMSLEMVKISGDDEVFTHEYNEWKIKIIVTNLDETAYQNVKITATLPAEINCIGYLFTHGILEIIQHGKGKSGAKEVCWTIESIGARQKLTLELILSTTKNPAGHQEFTSPGEYTIIKGALLTWSDISVGSTDPMIVNAKDKNEEPKEPKEPEVPKEPKKPEEPEKPEKPNEPEPEIISPKIDVLFLIDSTGSMGDEINVVKVKIEEIIFEVQNGTPKPEVRYAIVTYRDRRDTYITKSFDFTFDQDKIKSFLFNIVASGGGDGPESVNEALHVAINDCHWGINHVKMIFLIGDAPPHMDYKDDYDYRDEIEIAKQKEIKIHVIGCSGISSYTNGESIFKEIAEKTGGTYQKLIYSSDGAGDYSGGSGGYWSGYSDSSYYYPVSLNSTFDHETTCDIKISVSCIDHCDVDDDAVYHCFGESLSTSSKSCRGSLSCTKDSNICGNLLDVQLTYVIQQEAIKNGVSYENAVSLPSP
jgi:hypothetical protein